MTKICTKCLIEKPKEEFYKRDARSRRASCKSCDNRGHKEWVAKNPEASRKIKEKWDANNKDKRKQSYVNYRRRFPERILLRSAKNRAQKYGLDFNLEEKDITIPIHCPVFGFPLVMHEGRNGGRFNSPSLDRIDPEKGYVKGNIQIISYKANAMKSNASKEELLKFAEWIKNTI